MRYVTTAFIFYDNKLLVVLHKRIGKWLHVGGHLESDEDFEESLLREIKEEVGLDVEILNLEDKELFEYFFRNEPGVEIKPLIKPMFIHKTISDGVKRTALDYICIAKSNKVKLQEEELLEYKWITQMEIGSLDSWNTWKKLAVKAFEIYNDKFK